MEKFEIENKTLIKYNEEENIVKVFDGIEIINERAFAGAHITEIEIPPSVVEIKESAFENCTKLKTIIFKEGSNLKIIGKYAFKNCQSLNAISLPENLEIIKEGAFYQSGLVFLSIKNKTKIIENSAFKKCEELKYVTIEEGLETIGESAFEQDCKLETINFPSSLKKINNCAFGGCFSLKAVSLPEGLEKLGILVFSGCQKLETVSLPGKNLISIGTGVFYKCINLDLIITDNKQLEIYYTETSGPSKEKNLRYPLLKLIKEQPKLKSVIIPEGTTVVESIEDDIKYLEIPRSVQVFKTSFIKFEDKKIASIFYKGTLKDWCKITFDDAYRNPMAGAKKFYILNEKGEKTLLKDLLEIPNGVKEIKDYAFHGFLSIKELILPSSLEKIGNYAFCDCANLESIKFSKGLNSIGEYAFCCCRKLKEIVFPSTLKNIENAAFRECEKLNKIVLSDKIKELKMSVFGNCPNLKEVKLSSNLKTIRHSAFSECSSLKNLELPNSIRKIESDAIPKQTNVITNLDVLKLANFPSLKFKLFENENVVINF